MMEFLFVFPFKLLVTTGYLVDTSGYLVVTFSYLIATTGYFSLLLVPRFSNNEVFTEIFIITPRFWKTDYVEFKA